MDVSAQFSHGIFVRTGHCRGSVSALDSYARLYPAFIETHERVRALVRAYRLIGVGSKPLIVKASQHAPSFALRVRPMWTRLPTSADERAPSSERKATGPSHARAQGPECNLYVEQDGAALRVWHPNDSPGPARMRLSIHFAPRSQALTCVTPHA